MALKDLNAVEQQIAGQLLRDALAAGYAISVHDGEEIAIRRSRDAAAIKEAMATTDEDVLVLFRDGQRIGSIWLVYGNGSDLIADHTATPAITEIVAGANVVADRLAA